MTIGNRVSLVIPCYNEEKYIAQVVNNILSQTYPVSNIEAIFIDGNSTDSTSSIIQSFIAGHANFKLIHNPNRTVPFALNLAIKQSIGNPIIRLDAHTIYAPDYIEKVMETFNHTGADIVGGPMRAVGNTSFQRSVAYCTSTKFGVGDSGFHDESKEGYADSVYLGAWKREIFNEVGLFDEEMKRNQDDEFHYRAKSKGKKIYLNPEIKCWYYPRSSIKTLFKQYFQYGLFKPMVLKKVSSEIKLRHLIPVFFVLYLLSIPVLFYFFHIYSLLFLVGYLIIDFSFSFKNCKLIRECLYRILIYPIIHVAYGTGFLCGLFKS